MKSLLVTASMLAVLAFTPQAFAADLPARSSAPVYTKAPEFAPVNSWTGWYIGGNVGYGWGNNDMAFGDATSGLPGASGVANQTLNGHVNGVVGGGQVGYNWQVGSFVAGLEADFQGSGVKGTAQSPFALSVVIAGLTSIASSETTLNWFGTGRGRIGITVTPQLLLYGTGGLAYGEVSHVGNTIVSGAASQTALASVSETKVGWAAGAGAEWMFTRGWSAKFEYLHTDFGSSSATGDTIFNGHLNSAVHVGYFWNNRFDTVRAGVNYHFN
jgi:outer membrane immunogenic protein